MPKTKNVNSSTVPLGATAFRHSFSRINSPEMPYLLSVQVDSYEKFLQKDAAPSQRKNEGLEAVLRSVFPISDFSNTTTLEYVHYRLGEPTNTVGECRTRGTTYSVPLRTTLRLIIWEKDSASDERHIHDIKEQDVYLGELPLMTEQGGFVINGTDRVIVSQMHKSPGVFFLKDNVRTQLNGRLAHSVRIIPQRGSWVDVEFDSKEMVQARIDRKRKFPATILLNCLGLSDQDLLDTFYDTELIDLSEAAGQDPELRQYYKKIDENITVGQRAKVEIIDPSSKKVLCPVDRRITKRTFAAIQEAGLTRIPCLTDQILGSYSAKDIRNAAGELLVELNTPITADVLEQMLEAGVTECPILHIGENTIGTSLRDTMVIDGVSTQQEALAELYKRLRPGDPPTQESARNLLQNLFFNIDRYSLSRVGRLKINKKLGLETDLDHTTLTNEDIIESVRYLLYLHEGIKGSIDDIDHLGNRRIRTVGELLENHFRIGLIRMERAIKERMSLQETKMIMLHDIVNAKPIAAAINDFFNSSQLSQFMDQTNPLSELTHKRRLSALGPGGLTREWAGFDVRDVHTSHYGRICPIETPEGPNIGLIASLANFSSVNEFGFLETPYYRVADGVVLSEVHYLSAVEEDNYKIAQANAPLGPDNAFVNPLVNARYRSEFEMIGAKEIEFMDVAPHQLVSAATSLIPFLEHDDANRALMGSNMQRQAVPLIDPHVPLVGTGMEGKVAGDSGVCVTAKRPGIVNRVDSSRIVIEADVDWESEASVIPASVDIYHLNKFQRSNQSICINQRPIVKVGERVEQGQIIGDGPSCEKGELALGQNLLVAFMPWNGYNYEDSIVISESVVQQDLFTSIHIEQKEIAARETKLGREEITRDIPNMSEYALRDLDASGVVRVGTYVKEGDILVGKITPKGETQLHPEEKLLRAIFGEKAGDVRDSSLRVPQGMDGVVVDVVMFNRHGVEKCDRSQEIEQGLLARYRKDHEDETRIVHSSMLRLLREVVVGQTLSTDVVTTDRKVLCKKGEKVTEAMLEEIPIHCWAEVQLEKKKETAQVQRVVENTQHQIDLLENIYQTRCNQLMEGDDLPPGVLRVVKVYLAVKRKLSVGDKMAGRHGNKGVVSRIESAENMPYTESGQMADIVLNPLGVPSRMNVGQVLETHLGWAAHALGDQINTMLEQQHPLKQIRDHLKTIYTSKNIHAAIDEMDDERLVEMVKSHRKGLHFATPVFNGAKEEDLQKLMVKANLPASGQTTLYDGKTGEAFEQPITVGVIYMMKLHHLVDEKIHSRSIGPYSLVTQQPLGGKAQFGGQRFGEMEVWALEAYGAAYILQELMTVKSDDVMGRNRIYESIIKGQSSLETSIPESFKVLTSELKSLGLDVDITNTQ